MRKIILIVFALGLLLPMNSYAYITFIGVDPSVATENDINGIDFLTGSLGPFEQFPTTSNFEFNGNSYQSFSQTNLFIPPTILGEPYAVTFIGASTTLNNSGLFFSYSNPTAAAPTLGEVLDPSLSDISSKYELVLTESWTNPPGYVEIFGTTPVIFEEAGSLYTLNVVPLPSAVFLLAPGLLALFGLRRKLS